MADAPRDPRQLARDILSGKISIEDLAREQRRRQEARGGGGGVQGAPSQVPAKFPLPRPVQVKPVVRTVPPAQRPAATVLGAGLPRPPQRVPASPQRKGVGPRITPGVAGAGATQAQAKAAPGMTVPAAAPLSTSAAKQSGVYESGVDRGLKVGAEGRSRGVAGQATLQSMMRNRAALRRAVVMAEILGKPLSLRDE